jgi:CubicO group peptidase (beta-lactamase class C family)
MWLNGGNYGGRQYLNPSTIKTFTGKQPENHRGLGFDKPSEKGIHAESVPKSAYGHLGFTGCAMWVDPENEIVFIFLSNRINPSVSNQRINTAKIRQRVHQVVYDSFLFKSN